MSCCAAQTDSPAVNIVKDLHSDLHSNGAYGWDIGVSKVSVMPDAYPWSGQPGSYRFDPLASAPVSAAWPIGLASDTPDSGSNRYASKRFGEGGSHAPECHRQW